MWGFVYIQEHNSIYFYPAIVASWRGWEFLVGGDSIGVLSNINGGSSSDIFPSKWKIQLVIWMRLSAVVTPYHGLVIATSY